MIHCKDFDISKFTVTCIDFNNKYVKHMGMGFPKYNNQPFIFQTGYIRLSNDTKDLKKKSYNRWGPSYGNQEYDSMYNRFSIYESKEQKSCVELFDMLKKIDMYMSHEYTEKKLFNSDYPELHKKYNYENIIKLSKHTTKYCTKKDLIYYPRCTFRYLIKYEHGESTLGTKIYKKNTIESEPVLLDIKDIKEISKHINYDDTIRMIVRANHIWASKINIGGEKRLYGITFKILQLEVIPIDKSHNININKYLFDTYKKSDKKSDKKTNKTPFLVMDACIAGTKTWASNSCYEIIYY